MPSKTTPQNLIDLQFIAEHFNAVTNFSTFLQSVIDRQEALLSARLGSTVFDSATTAIADQVKNAALCFCAAELLQLRINRLSGNVDTDSVALLRALQATRSDYLKTVEEKVSRLITSGAAADSGGYAGGVLTTSRDDEGLVPLWPTSEVC